MVYAPDAREANPTGYGCDLGRVLPLSELDLADVRNRRRRAI